jgi:hypothetical protein
MERAVKGVCFKWSVQLSYREIKGACSYGSVQLKEACSLGSLY